MKRVGLVIAAIAVAATLALRVGAVCLDENAISGYHIPLEKELRAAYVVVIGTVVAEKKVPGRSEKEFWGGTTYRFKVEETLRGKRYKQLHLFSENTSGRFPMDVGHRYLAFVTKADDGTFWVSPCGSSGELPQQSHVLEWVRKNVRHVGKG